MDFGDSIGILPEDLVTQIVVISGLKSASSILLSCKYWYNKYRRILNHDTIVINNDILYNGKDAEFPKTITIKNGRVIRYGEGLYKMQGRYSSNRTTIGHFDTVGDLVQFLNQFNTILKANLSSLNEPDPSQPEKIEGFWMRMQNSTKTKYYSLSNDCVGTTILKGHTAAKLCQLVADLKLVNLDRHDEEIIRIEIFERNPTYLRDSYYSNTIHISKQGDVEFEVWLDGCGFEQLRIKASPDLYDELKEMIVHTKHKNDMKAMEDFKFNSYSTIRGFFAGITVNDQSYWIAEYEEIGNDQKKVLARRPDLVKKLAKVLEMGLYGPKMMQNPHHNHKEVRKLPPTHSIMYNIARRFPYCVDLLGLPRTFFITAIVNRGKKSQSIQLCCSNNMTAPIEELIQLFHFVESQLDPVNVPKTNPMPTFRVGNTAHGSEPISLNLEILSISCFKTVKSVKREVVLRIWAFIEKYYRDCFPPE